MAKYYLKNGDIEEGPFDLHELRHKDLSDFVEFREEGQTPWEPIDRLETFLVTKDSGEVKNWTAEFMMDGTKHELSVNPDIKSLHEGIPQRFEIRMDNTFFGNIIYNSDGWQMDISHPQRNASFLKSAT